MRYRKLGKWGVRVSSVGLGSWLTYGGTTSEETAKACIDHAYHSGVNFFDTANVYGNGEAELVLGSALKRFPRDSFVLASKVYFPVGPGPNDRGLSRKHILNQLDASLRRLETDYLDLYQCHRYDTEVPLEETCSAMNDLVRRGKILYWGVSEWSASEIEGAYDLCRSNGWSVPVSNQPQYNALCRSIERSVLPATERIGMGNVVWSPLAMGVLAGRYRNVDDIPSGSRAATDARETVMGRYFEQSVLDAVADVSALAKENGWTAAQLALAWCLRQPAVSSTIVGASKPEQLTDTLAASDLDVPQDVFKAMDKLLTPHSDLALATR